uniref:Kinesin family member 15 n=1 Tax=Salarias fasciatus TaxID=181472 RepID=A0A672IH02_SALFA
MTVGALWAYSGDTDSIKVFVRVRPLTQGTGLTTDGDQNLCLTVTSPNTIRLLSKPEPRTFIYDHVADMDTSQDSVFTCVAKNIVESCMNGYNGTIFAYGQTGSGKTFTMLGPSDLDNFTHELRGVIPRSFEYLFFLISREVEKSSQSKSFLCKCSFIEIYNEQIYDLLDTASASLFLRENIKKGVFVEGAVEKFVNSAAEAYQVLSMGWRNRRVASTSMNRESSRSHAVFTMTLESKESINEVVNIRMSQLNLVDLAGSERQKDTHTEGSRLKEASSINRSLMCLGQVIMALVDVSNGKNRHICYRDSKLTFLLRDSLGGNAKTFIIANVHPGSKCFGETLSTLQFAQRAKLIKNKAVINEDTQGNVRQLQAEVKKLKEQLAHAMASQGVDCGRNVAPGGPEVPTDVQHDMLYKAKFVSAVHLWKRQDEEIKILLTKVAQLKEACSQKDKFVESSKMITKFREEHISRLEKKLKAGQSSLSDEESQTINQLKEEIKILRHQVEHHPKMTRYAAENYSLRQENSQLRSLEWVTKAQEAEAEVAAELEEAFQKVLESEGLTDASVASDNAAAVERLNAKLLQKQSDLTAALQAFDEYKEVTKKQMSQLESDKRYLDKSNKHLENILKATNDYKNKEVSELNRIHVETIKILSTPTKAYNLRSRLVPLSSPEHLNGTECVSDDVKAESPPVTPGLICSQENASHVQTQLNEEELKNNKLTQQIVKLEEQIVLMSQELESKDQVANRNSDQLTAEETINSLQQSLQSEQQAAEVLRTEIRDLRLVLESSDKELQSVKNELKDGQSEQQREMSQLSSSLIATQLQLDKVRLEWEQLLEQHRALQDSFDQLQAEAKFDADQAKEQMTVSQQEIEELKTQVLELNISLQTEQERANALIAQLRENKESTSKELIETVEHNAHLKKQISDLTAQNQQQISKLADLEQNLTSANERIKSLQQKTEQDSDVVLDLINQTRDLRSELSQKDQTISHLTEDFRDISVKYNAACLEREDVREQNSKLQAEISDMKLTVEKNTASNKIEVEVLEEELLYATKEVERLTKVLDELNSLLLASQEQTAQKDAIIQDLRQRVNRGTPRTPVSLNREVSEMLESQERELENRRSSMMTMEVLLAELNAERTAKNEEIERLKMQLSEKEMMRMEIQALLNEFCIEQSHSTQNGNQNGEGLNDAVKLSLLKELQEERAEKEPLPGAQRHESAGAGRAEAAPRGFLTSLRFQLGWRELSDSCQTISVLQENEVLRSQNIKLSEENGKLVGHKNHKQKIEYLVKLKKDNTHLQEENVKLRAELCLLRESAGCPQETV